MENNRLLTLDQAEEWERLLRLLPVEKQDVYFTPQYYSLHQDKGDGTAICFVYEKDGDLALYPFLLNCINDINYDLVDLYYDIQGAYGYNGAVATTSDKSFRMGFFANFGEFARQHKLVTEFTRFHPIIQNQIFHRDMLETVFDRMTVVIDLSKGYDNVYYKQYDSNTRNMIRKAEVNGYKYKILHSNAAFSDFAKIYIEQMIRISADPEYFFPLDYFDSIANRMSGNSFIVAAFDNNGIVAASLFLHMGIYSHYHLSGRLDSCKDNSVSSILIDMAVRYSIENKMKWMHLGGGRTPNAEDSLMKFKLHFSHDCRDFHIGKKIIKKRIYDQIIKIWSAKYPTAARKYSKRLQGYRITC